MRTADLTTHEFAALIDAVRRDMKAEADRAATDPAWADVHRHNARVDLGLLEALNPKHTAPRHVAPEPVEPVIHAAVASPVASDEWVAL